MTYEYIWVIIGIVENKIRNKRGMLVNGNIFIKRLSEDQKIKSWST